MAKKIWLFFAIALAVLFIGFSVFLPNQPQSTLKGLEPAFLNEAAKTPANERAALMQIATAQTRHFKGDPDAPVTILEFSDFQ